MEILYFFKRERMCVFVKRRYKEWRSTFMDGEKIVPILWKRNLWKGISHNFWTTYIATQTHIKKDFALFI